MGFDFDMSRIGQTISRLRRAHDMTQMQLADEMDVSYQAVSNWERGQTMPDISKLPELAELLGITIDDLLGRSAPLISKAAQGKLEEHLQKADITAEEAAEAAPLLTPAQMDRIADKVMTLSSHRSQPDALGAEATICSSAVDIHALLPFISTAKVDELLLDAAAQQQPITPYLPFASSHVLEKLAVQMQQQGAITQLLPFLSTSYVDNLAAQGGDVSPLLPFMSTKAVDALALERLRTRTDVTPLLPFISSGLIDRLVQACLSHTKE